MAMRWAERAAARPKVAPRKSAPSTVVRRLTVGRADHPLERAADAMAARVVANLDRGSAAGEATATRIQRASAARGSGREVAEQVPARIQRMSSAIGPDGGTVDDDVQARLERSRG